MDPLHATAAASGAAAAPPPWWRGAVVYENHLPSFKDGERRRDRRPRGADRAASTTSAARSASTRSGSGRAGARRCSTRATTSPTSLDVEPTFGDLATFDRLIEEAHARGIRILVDYIPNHSSDQHPWFVESRSSRDNPQARLVHLGRPGARRRPAEQLDGRDGRLRVGARRAHRPVLPAHPPASEQPDLNWRNPEVRAAMLDVLRFWLDRGVDGVRIDVAHMLMKDPELRDNPPAPPGQPQPVRAPAPRLLRPAARQRPLPPRRARRDAEIRAVLDEFGAVAIGEIEAMEWDAWAQYYGEELDGVQLPFAFKLIETPWDARTRCAASSATLEGALPDGRLAGARARQPRPLAARDPASGARRRGSPAMLLLTLARHAGAALRRRARPRRPGRPARAPARPLRPRSSRTASRTTRRARRCRGTAAPTAASRPRPRRGSVAAALRRVRDDQRRGAARRPGVDAQPLPRADRAAQGERRAAARRLRRASGRRRATLLAFVREAEGERSSSCSTSSDAAAPRRRWASAARSCSRAASTAAARRVDGRVDLRAAEGVVIRAEA